jgi:hypothetical protein
MSTLFKNLLFAKLGSCQVVYKISRNVIKGFLLFCHDVLQKIRCTDGTAKIKNLKRRKTKNTWNQGSRFRSLWLTVDVRFCCCALMDFQSWILVRLYTFFQLKTNTKRTTGLPHCWPCRYTHFTSFVHDFVFQLTCSCSQSRLPFLLIWKKKWCLFF